MMHSNSEQKLTSVLKRDKYLRILYIAEEGAAILFCCTFCVNKREQRQDLRKIVQNGQTEPKLQLWDTRRRMFFSLFILRNINGRPHRVAPTASGQAALRSDFRNENQSHAPLFLLFREKSRLRMLCVCKRTHNAFAALPTFHGIYGERTSVSDRKSRGVYVAFYTSMRVEMQSIS